MGFGAGGFGRSGFATAAGPFVPFVAGGGVVVVVALALLPASSPMAGAARGADILTPESRADLPSSVAQLGAISASSDGDVARATYRQALRSRVARMLRSARNAYAHLPGWGTAPPVKGQATPSAIAELETSIARDLASDPDVREVEVKITPGIAGSRTVLVDVVIRDRFGDTHEINGVEV